MKQTIHKLLLLTCSTSAILLSSPARAELQIHWKLDELSGNVAADSSGNGIDGTWAGVAGSPGWVPGGGVDGGSALFSGVDGDCFVNEPFDAITGTPLTLSAWVKTASTAKDGLVYLGDGATGNSYYLLQIQAGNGKNVARNPAEIAATGSSVNDGEWHHVLGVNAGTAERRIYIDGVLVTTEVTDVPEVFLNRFGIGALTRSTPLAPVDLFTGELDDVALWDRAFTDLDAAALNGLGVLGAGNAADLDPLVEAFADQEAVAISGRNWNYATGLDGGFGATGGSVVSLTAYIVLDEFGNGMRMTSEPGNPIIVSYSATPTTVFLGESATISWELDDTDSASIDQGVGPIDNASGSVEVMPTETTIYTLTANNGNGSTSPEVTITVIPDPVITTFTVSPSVIFAGEDVTLSWEVQNFTMLEIDEGVGTVMGAIGETIVNPTETTTYTLTATNDNPGAMATAMGTVTVLPEPPPRELLLHWPLDEGAGTTTADLAGVNPGIFLETGGAVTWTTGVMGGALTFPNLNDVAVRAITETPLVEDFPFSIGGWVKTTDSANDTFAVLGTNQGGQYQSLLVRGGNAQALTRSGGFFTQTGPAVNDDSWHYIVGVYAHPASLTLYVDGVFAGERTTEAGAFVLPDRFAIGALARTDTSVVDAFNGSVDDVSFWRGVLQENEVLVLNNGATGLGLNASDMDALLTGFEGQTSTIAAGLTWTYRDDLVGELGATGGSVAAADAFIVLDEEGAGMASVPPNFSIISVVKGDDERTITWYSSPGAIYIVQFSSDLKIWDEVDDSVLSQGETTAYPDTDPVRFAAPRGYYRIIQAP
ncbi:MAG: LamG domain-containing protein [Verrucomicrobiales bacterium]